jgi:hypothetical protein
LLVVFAMPVKERGIVTPTVTYVQSPSPSIS